MIYNNLIALLAVVLILSTSSEPETSRFSFLETGLLFLLKGLVFFWLVGLFYGRRRVRQMADYLRAEQRGAILAVAFLAMDVYLLDGKYFLARLPLAAELPVVTDIGGLVIYFSYLIAMWSKVQGSYTRVTRVSERPLSFLLSNLKINVTILLPWVLLSLTVDSLMLIKSPKLQSILTSSWGEGTILLFFFLILLIGFPVIMVRLWGCTPLPLSSARNQIEQFCKEQRVRYREILLWPLFGGRMLTAGVVGLVGRFRYLLITPALLESLTPDEVQAVVAHEAGHVKHHHMFLYIFLFMGIGLLLPLSVYPGTMLFMWQPELILQALQPFEKNVGDFLIMASVLSLLILVILYVRFLFGFFMRNFERQADIFSARALGSVAPLVRVFEKIALLSGNTRDLPSWHHFGIGRRIDFLLHCQRHPKTARRHDLKVYTALVLYGLILVGGGFFKSQLSGESLVEAPSVEFTLAVLEWKAKAEPDNPLWHQALGDLQANEKNESEAYKHYERAFSLAPDNAELLNNFAWLLVTAVDPAVHDHEKGLVLAKKAAAKVDRGFVLDTYATALWMNGFREEALAVEMRAMELDPEDRDYYRQQMEKFLNPPDRAEPDSGS